MMRILFLPIVLNLALAAAGVVCSASDSSIDVDFLCGAKGAGARLYAGQPYLLHVSLQGDNAQMLDDAVAGSLHLVGPLPHSRDYLGSFKADTVSGSIDVPIELEESGRYRVAMSLDGELLDCGGVEIEALPRPQMTSETCVAKEEELVGEEEEEEVCREGLSLTGEGVLEHRGPEAGEETAFVASWSASNTAPCGSVRRALSSHTGWELKFSRSHLGEGRGTKQKGDGDGEEVEVVLHPTVRSLGPLTLSFRYAAPTVAGRHTLLLCWTGDANGRSVCASPRRVDIAAGLVSVEKSAFYCPQAPAEHGDAEHSPSAVGGAIDAMDTLHSPREKGVDWRRAVREGLKRGMLVPAVSCSIFLRDAYGNDAGGRHGYSHRSDASRGLKIKVKVASTPGVPKPSIAEGESTTKPGVYTGKWQEVDIDLPWPSLRTSKLSYDQRDPESGVERKGGEDDEPAASCRGAHFEDGERLALCRPPPLLVADPEAKRPENWNDNDDVSFGEIQFF